MELSFTIVLPNICLHKMCVHQNLKKVVNNVKIMISCFLRHGHGHVGKFQ